MYKKKITIGISGGVDSTACCFLLHKKYNITAVFMQNWEKNKNEFCNTKKNLETTKHICKYLKIKLKIANFSLDYYKNVFTKVVNDYKQNKTPNPDTLCNKKIKFNIFLKYALTFNTKYIATGHYSKIRKINNNILLSIPKDKKKDQTYFLCLLKKTQLKKTIFPLENYFKKDIRLLLKKNNCQNYKKKDSTGICFIENKNFNIFLQKYIKKRYGITSDTKGNKIGKHIGIPFYTIGQRKGLEVNKSTFKNTYIVVKKVLKNNILIIAEKNNNKIIFNNIIYLEKINNNPKTIPKINTMFSTKIRYQQKIQETLLKHISRKKCILFFLKKQKAITPGQITALYKKNLCIGGGVISKFFFN